MTTDLRTDQQVNLRKKYPYSNKYSKEQKCHKCPQSSHGPS